MNRADQGPVVQNYQSLVKFSYNIYKNTIFFAKNCEELLQGKSSSLFFSKKITTTDYVSTAIINKPSTNDFVKLTML